MRLPIYKLDAFTDRLFGGNPAAVCILEKFLPDAILQAIACENNLAATAFIVPVNNDYQIRWFAPLVEEDLCGHGTLASAYVVLNKLKPDTDSVIFHSAKGPLQVFKKEDGYFEMELPALDFNVCVPSEQLIQALGIVPVETYRSRRYLALLASEQDVRSIKPNNILLAQLDLLGVIVTAKGDDVDFVSRYFAPAIGIPEDPATGSAHCVLTPFWSQRLGKKKLHAKQLSKRQGEIYCELHGDRVVLRGKVMPYLEGVIEL